MSITIGDIVYLMNGSAVAFIAAVESLRLDCAVVRAADDSRFEAWDVSYLCGRFYADSFKRVS